MFAIAPSDTNTVCGLVSPASFTVSAVVPAEFAMAIAPAMLCAPLDAPHGDRVGVACDIDELHGRGRRRARNRDRVVAGEQSEAAIELTVLPGPVTVCVPPPDQPVVPDPSEMS